jgi:NodT family efflux transporter outer membrane factor (OMF) lipoprotein
MSRPAVAALAAALLAACAVGPNFKPPEAPRVDGYTQQPLPQQTAAASTLDGAAQRFVPGQDIPAEWWQVFGSPPLDALVSQALKQNPTIEAARAALRQANELTAAQRGALFPSLDAGYSVNRQKNAVGTLAPTLTSGEELFTLHTAQISVSYLLDVFGLERRQIESQQALADAQRFELEAAYLTISSNVVAAAVQEASLRAQIEATNAIIVSEREAVQILERQYQLGSVAMLDVMAQQSSLASTQATLPGLEKQLAAQRDLLAVLVGRFPSEGIAAEFDLTGLMLPRDLPVSLPAHLVRQRPDVLAAEAQLHSASAQVGVAIADMLPQITLTGSAGGASTMIQSLFAGGNTFWTAGASLSQTLFAGGTLWHHERAAEAALDQAGAQYRTVVLAAFQQVADTLHALELDADAVGANARATQAASDTLKVTRRNVELGSMSYLALLSAQQSYQQAVLNLAQARANRLADTAALFQALGGGWWNRAQR